MATILRTSTTRARKKHRNAQTPEARLKQFQQAVMFGPIFICICCHIKMFTSNVREFTKAVIAQFEEKVPLANCIVDMNVITKVQTESHYLQVPATVKNKQGEVGKRFICEACGKCFFYKRTLRNHFRAIHEGMA